MQLLDLFLDLLVAQPLVDPSESVVYFCLYLRVVYFDLCLRKLLHHLLKLSPQAADNILNILLDYVALSSNFLPQKLLYLFKLVSEFLYKGHIDLAARCALSPAHVYVSAETAHV